MSELILFLVSFPLGFLARVIFLPATAIHKRCNPVTGALCDLIFAVLAGIPFLLALRYIGNGEVAFYPTVAFLLSLAVSFKLKRKKKQK